MSLFFPKLVGLVLRIRRLLSLRTGVGFILRKSTPSWTQSGKIACVWNPSASLPPAFPVPPCFPRPSLLPERCSQQSWQLLPQSWLQGPVRLDRAGPCSSRLPLLSCSHIGSDCMVKSLQGKPGELGQGRQAALEQRCVPLFLKVHIPATWNWFWPLPWTWLGFERIYSESVARLRLLWSFHDWRK